jgi:inward rectifier potassium channel
MLCYPTLMARSQKTLPDRLLTAPPSGRRAHRPRFDERDEGERLLIIGRHSTAWRDLYHQALKLTWPQFLLVGTALFVFLNTVFAVLYSAQPRGITDLEPGSLSQAFFFSVQTLATIGYGRWAPVSTYANAVVTVETLVGVSTIALFTALAFARFARPTAKIVFSRSMVVTRFDGVKMLMLRLANERANQILEARVSLALLRDDTTVEGEYIRRLYDLKLVRDHTPVLGMSFLVMHRIDESSPLFGYTPERLAAEWVEIVALVSGLDETMMQNVHARASYDGSEILFGRRFADLFGFLPDGARAMDYRQFHVTEPEIAP